MADEARNGVEEDVRSGFLDWLFRFSVKGDDGNLYSLGGYILSLAVEMLDLVVMCYALGTVHMDITGQAMQKGPSEFMGKAREIRAFSNKPFIQL